MKEYVAGLGGRYTYADDFENLQDLAKTCDRLFVGCDAFVLTGCVLTITDATNHKGNLSEGYVWLDGKVRHVAAETSRNLNSSNTVFLKPRDTSELVAYQDGTPKTGRVDYACAVQLTQPSGAYLRIQETNTVTVERALFGRYSLLLDGGQQEVAGPTVFGALTTFTSGLQVGNNSNGLSLDDDVLRLFGDTSSLLLGGSGASVMINGTQRALINADGLTVNGNITGGALVSGNFSLTADGLMERSTNDVADMWINKFGYQGGITQFRNFKVGNGKNSEALIEALGASSTVSLLGGLLQAVGGTSNEVSVNGMLKVNNIALKIGNQYVTLDERYAQITALSNYVTSTALTTQYSTTETVQNMINTAESSILNTVSNTYVASSDLPGLIKHFNGVRSGYVAEQEGIKIEYFYFGTTGVMGLHLANATIYNGHVDVITTGLYSDEQHDWHTYCIYYSGATMNLAPCTIDYIGSSMVITPIVPSGVNKIWMDATFTIKTNNP